MVEDGLYHPGGSAGADGGVSDPLLGLSTAVPTVYPQSKYHLGEIERLVMFNRRNILIGWNGIGILFKILNPFKGPIKDQQLKRSKLHDFN